MSFTAKKQCTIHAPISKVWAGLTTPELVKQYFFGTALQTTWEVGTPIIFQGEWDSTAYKDQGTVLQFKPENMLRYDYLSSWSNLEDKPENYQIITYRVKKKGDSTILIIEQAKIPTLEQKIHSAQNWGGLMKGLKGLLKG